MKVLDMYSGLGGWAGAFRERGHDVVTTDINPDFGCTITGDILDDAVLDAIIKAGPYHLVLASPPCEGFSVMNIGKNWTPPPEHAPKTDTARLAVRLVERTLRVIAITQPLAWVIENPRAKLRKLPVMHGIERRTVTYCKYGETRMKPTDLWGGFPPSLVLHAPCSNGDPCHESAPRGSRSGTQGIKGSAARAEIPYLLSLAVCEAMERDLAGATRWPDLPAVHDTVRPAPVQEALQLDPVVTEEEAAERAICPKCGVSLHGTAGEGYVNITQTFIGTMDERGSVWCESSTVDTICTCGVCGHDLDDVVYEVEFS